MSDGFTGEARILFEGVGKNIYLKFCFTHNVPVLWLTLTI